MVKVTLYYKDGTQSTFSNVGSVETVNDIAMLDGITHTNVSDVEIK